MQKFDWKQWGTLLVVISVIAFLLIDRRTEDTAVFHRFLARHAGETAVDCGIIPIETNPESGQACALEYNSDPSSGSRTGTVIYQRTCINPEFNTKQTICDDFKFTVRIPISLRDTFR